MLLACEFGLYVCRTCFWLVVWDSPLYKERERERGGQWYYVCFQWVSEQVLKWGKGYIPAKYSAWKRARERERDWKKVWATKADCVGKKHDKGRKRAENRSGSWGDTEIMIRRFRRKTPVSDTDRLMNRGLVNVSESERSLLNSPLTQSDGLILYVCVCLVYLGSLVSRHESDLTQPPSGTPSSVFSWKHESYSAFLTFPP